MREIRSSGSVEGVMSNRDPYSDSTSGGFFLLASRHPNCQPCQSGDQQRTPRLADARFILFYYLAEPASGKRQDRTNFHATKSSAGNLRRYRRRGLLVSCFNQVVAAELLLGFRERAIRGQRLAISYAHSLPFGRGMK